MARPMRPWLLVAGLLAVFPWLPGVGSSAIGAGNLAASYALVAVSLVLLTGWVGQISLGHAAFVGVGAYASGYASAAIGLPFPLSLPVAVVAAALAATTLGVVALRVRGLFLAVATLIFSWMASEFLFHQEWMTRHSNIPGRVIGGEGTAPIFDFTQRRTFFYVAWAVALVGLFVAANLRDSKTGRAFFAIRGSEMATASLGINVTRYKLMAFALSGGLAGAAGNLIMSDSRAVVSDQFTFTVSLFYLAIAVVGGLRSLAGAASSAVFFAALSELFFQFPTLAGYLEVVSALLLAVTLAAYPGGLAALGAALRPLLLRAKGRLPTVALPERTRPRESGRVVMANMLRGTGSVLVWMAGPLAKRRREPVALLDWDTEVRAEDVAVRTTVEFAPSAPAAHTGNGNGSGSVPRAQRPVLLEADGVTVRFGGLTAVGNASLQVRQGQITGLIGPNGAGKTTLFNTIAGFVTPTEGAVRLFGRDVTSMPVHARAELGVARTFQAIQLFPQLTVFENLLVATHLQNGTGVFSHMVASERSLAEERRARARVRKSLVLLDLAHVADARVVDLPFGVLRMVEIARAVVTGFRLMMLDEPASGLDNTETDRLAELTRFLRDLGVSILLIEHDVRMVTSVSDHLYVLEQGRIIAEGPPEEIQRNPAVIAAYLGEEEPVGVPA